MAAMPSATSTTSAPAAAVPGVATGLTGSATTSTTITVSWQAPTTGGTASSYIVQFRLTGTTSWTSSPAIVGATSYQLTALQPATSYDIAVEAQNAAGSGAASAILTTTTSSAAQPAAPPQVTGLAVSATSSNTIQLSWSNNATATSFTVQYRVSGSASWTSSIAGVTGTAGTISGLQASTSYDVSVIAVNAVGSGPASATITTMTLAASQAVTSITWNLTPSGSYTHASGSIGVNAHVSPASSPVQFGFSASATTPPSSWTAAVLVNTDLWGAYVPTPATAGNWYTWAEGTDGSAVTVSPSTFQVQ